VHCVVRLHYRARSYSVARPRWRQPHARMLPRTSFIPRAPNARSPAPRICVLRVSKTVGGADFPVATSYRLFG
jgi:hypothetical protein